MAKNILIIGNGGRENALAWKIRKDGHNAVLKTGTHEELIDFARKENIYLTIVGPDQYLADGAVDDFQKVGLRIFGPTKEQARIESSKAFAKDLMRELDIPTAKQYDNIPGVPIVIKKSGLALGKGVTVAHTMAEAEKAIESIKDDEIVIEEYLTGREVSTHAFCDGKTFKLFPTSKDHKQIFDGDKGPNTGGMGTISPALDFDASEIVGKIVKKLEYKGVLYPGLMITDNGPRVLEFNARFGDPETQSYMRLLKTDLVDIADACIDGKLDSLDIEWHEGFACCIVMASAGYPGDYEKGFEITGIEEAEKIKDVVVFPAGMTLSGSTAQTSGGRVLGVSAIGATLDEALDLAYSGVNKINFKGMQYRKDIGKR